MWTLCVHDLALTWVILNLNVENNTFNDYINHINELK